MELHSFDNFSKLFKKNDDLTLVFVKEDEKKTCRSKIIEITDKELFVKPETTQEQEIPQDQILSIIYSSPDRLYGFHSHRTDKNTKNTNICLSIPNNGWKIQRRKYPRIKLLQEAIFKLGIKSNKGIILQQEEISCFIYNISQGGLNIQTNQKLPVGQYVELVCTSKDCPIEEPCVVVWGFELPAEKRPFNYQFTYGLRFVLINDSLKKTIEKLEKKLEPDR